MGRRAVWVPGGRPGVAGRSLLLGALALTVMVFSGCSSGVQPAEAVEAAEPGLLVALEAQLADLSPGYRADTLTIVKPPAGR